MRLRILHDTPARLIARLGNQDGPILATSQVTPMLSMHSADDGRDRTLEVYPDGGKLVEARLTLSHVPADLRVTMRIFVGGVTFEDGTIVKTITAADFDENGEYRYRMLRSPNAVNGDCHYILFWENQTQL